MSVCLIVGGESEGVAGTAEIYNPGGASFSPTGSLSVARYPHSATALLAQGFTQRHQPVLIAGGMSTNGAPHRSAEVYDLTSGTFAATKGLMTVARHHHTATLLSNGDVLLCGGMSTNGVTAQTDVYSRAAGTF